VPEETTETFGTNTVAVALQPISSVIVTRYEPVNTLFTVAVVAGNPDHEYTNGAVPAPGAAVTEPRLAEHVSEIELAVTVAFTLVIQVVSDTAPIEAPQAVPTKKYPVVPGGGVVTVKELVVPLYGKV